MGGGRRHWLPKVTQDPEQTSDEGRRLDGRNLIDDWVRDKKKRNIKAEYVWTKGQLDKIDPQNVDHLLGENLVNVKFQKKKIIVFTLNVFGIRSYGFTEKPACVRRSDTIISI